MGLLTFCDGGIYIQMVFSSSETVHGQPEVVPCVEDFELEAMNPYGRTKVLRSRQSCHFENILISNLFFLGVHDL